jgi:hypothetical protein
VPKLFPNPQGDVQHRDHFDPFGHPFAQRFTNALNLLP